jgi:U3 small nucleolar RNA-associated protein 11
MSGASSMRNAVKRITHKERDQPSDRKKKFGPLEKHVDYKVRADDYKKKKNYVKNLKIKALERNPDEFYFNMNNSKVENGQHRDNFSTKRSLDVSQAKIFKTQDLGYLNMKNAIEKAKMNKLRETLHWTDRSIHPPKSHKKFIDQFDDDSVYDELSAEKRELLTTVNADDLKTVNSTVSRQYKELYARTKRSAKLEETIANLNVQRNVMGKGAKRKIQLEDGSVHYKWKRIRAK